MTPEPHRARTLASQLLASAAERWLVHEALLEELGLGAWGVQDNIGA